MPKSDLQGQLLVAKPSILGDPSFHRAVVLLAQKNNESTLGFILNKPLDITLNTLLPEIEIHFPYFMGVRLTRTIFFISTIKEIIFKIASPLTINGTGGEILKMSLAKSKPSSCIPKIFGFLWAIPAGQKINWRKK